MRSFHLLIPCIALGLAPVPAADTGIRPDTASQAIEELRLWLAQPREKRTPAEPAGFAVTPLSKADVVAAGRLLWEEHARFIRATRAKEMEAKVIELGGQRMKFETVSFGGKESAPAGGRSLFISMHGGGGGPAEVNEQQWENQVRLAKAYNPREGIYLAPRAPTNAWNLWHQAHIDDLFARLIENLVVIEGVNPNRVYIFGYSAGGDGVYQLAPRMADRWAAASMMAGHPNAASPLGLRNIGFSIQAGALDSAYRRNKVAAEWGAKLDQLQKADPAGYAHFTEVHAGKGHWMDLEDRKAIPWMEKFTRNPLPDRIVWHQDGVLHTHFYWLSLPKDTARAGQDIVAERKGQTIDVHSKDVSTVVVRLNDRMLNLDEPVTILSGGKTLFSGKLTRTIGTLRRTLEERGDPELVFSAEVTVTGVQP